MINLRESPLLSCMYREPVAFPVRYSYQLVNTSLSRAWVKAKCHRDQGKMRCEHLWCGKISCLGTLHAVRDFQVQIRSFFDKRSCRYASPGHHSISPIGYETTFWTSGFLVSTAEDQWVCGQCEISLLLFFQWTTLRYSLISAWTPQNRYGSSDKFRVPDGRLFTCKQDNLLHL